MSETAPQPEGCPGFAAVRGPPLPSPWGFDAGWSPYKRSASIDSHVQRHDRRRFHVVGLRVGSQCAASGIRQPLRVCDGHVDALFADGVPQVTHATTGHEVLTPAAEHHLAGVGRILRGEVPLVRPPRPVTSDAMRHALWVLPLDPGIRLA